MSKLADVTFIGASGTNYEFEVYPWGTNFNAVGAVYFVTERSRNSDGGYNHSRIYVGQTSDLSERFDDHHKAGCFGKKGANCICVHTEDIESRRLRIEADLIAKYAPPCNG